MPRTSRSAAPCSLPGLTLPAGTYMFAVVNPYTGSDAVKVTSRDRLEAYALKLTRSSLPAGVARHEGLITFGEAPAGTPPPVKAWYPDGDTLGREFIY